MIDLSKRTLSEAIQALGEEINRGCWLLDRRSGVPVEMVREVQITAIVTAHPDRLVVESIAASEVGPQTQNQSQTQQQTQTQQSNTAQSGANTNTTTNHYKEL